MHARKQHVQVGQAVRKRPQNPWNCTSTWKPKLLSRRVPSLKRHRIADEPGVVEVILPTPRTGPSCTLKRSYRSVLRLAITVNGASSIRMCISLADGVAARASTTPGSSAMR